MRDLDSLLQLEETESTKKDIAECFTKYAESKKAQAAKKAEESKDARVEESTSKNEAVKGAL